jgi:cyclopropane-fatty-acyl-phospholipid synthase
MISRLSVRRQEPILEPSAPAGLGQKKVSRGARLRRRQTTVGEALEPLFRIVLGGNLPVRIEFWDGSVIGPTDAAGVGRFHSVDAIRRLLWSPDELGLGRAFVVGEVDIEGDLLAVLAAVEAAGLEDIRIGPRTLATALGAAWRVGALGFPPAPPPHEARPRGRLHSKDRDAGVIRHHYDVGNDFYRLVLGPSLTYSCARFADEQITLEDAQAAKHEMVCAKLGLRQRPGMRLLDVGCGWGSMALHAATFHGATVVGLTISEAQAGLARRRVAESDVSHLIDIRRQDYREVDDGPYDAVSSIGMFEHVGRTNTDRYFEILRAQLRPGGRLLNHAISVPGGFTLGHRSFAHRYIFPDGELADVGDVALAMERAGFEVRDVESLREHYARTLRHWLANLERNWDSAVADVGVALARTWRLYLAGSAVNFDSGELAVHQVLGVVPGPNGASGMPATRDGWS